MAGMVRSEAAALDLRGGHAAVDLINTVAWRGDPNRRTEFLVDYRDLVAWAQHARVMSPREAHTLAAHGAADDGAATRTLRRVKELREALQAIWTGCGSARDAEQVAGAYRSALRAKRLAFDENIPRWRDTALTVQTPLHRLAFESVTLLTAVPRSRVKRCGDDACGWLFLDASHRQNRCWCSTADCGNRARVRRFYERARDKSDGQAGGS
jgi:predicted RNA-binding Zn ribbon-like protein